MSLPNNLGRLAAGLTADASLNIGVGVTPSGTFRFEVGTTSKFTGVATFGSTLSNGTYTYTLPSATGTLALTSDLSGYLPLTGGTLTGALGGTSASFSGSIQALGSLITGNTSTQIVSSIENYNATMTGGTRLSFKYQGTETAFIYNRFNGGDFNTDFGSNDYLRFMIGASGGTERMRLTSTSATFIIPALSANTYVSNVNFTDNTNNTGHFGIIRNSTSGNGAFYGADGIVELYTNMSGTNVKALSLSTTGAATFSSSVTAGGSGNVIIGADATYSNYNTIGFGGILANGQNRIFAGNSSIGDGLYLQSKQGIDFWVGGTNSAMYIASSRNIIIGNSTTDAGYKLDVNGTGRFVNSVTAASFITPPTASSGSTSWTFAHDQYFVGDFGLYASSSATPRIFFNAAGNVLVGTTTNNGGGLFQALSPNGLNAINGQVSNNNNATLVGFNSSSAYTFYVLGTGAIYSTSPTINIIASDRNLKTDIKDYDKGLNEILLMKPRYYKYKDNLEEEKSGFIAQEMDEAIPGSMINSPMGNHKTYQVDWYPLLVKAIQELSAKNEALIKRIETLENK